MIHKTLEDFLNESLQEDKSLPETYTNKYNDDETFTGITRIKRGEYQDNAYTGEEYRELFMYWYNRIKPYLDDNDEHGVLEELLEWDEETLAKMDMYNLVRNYFKNNK